MNAPVRSTSALAVASLICGVLGIAPLPVVGSLVAIITGHMARGAIRRAPDHLDGDALAVAGLVLGYTVLALWLVAIALFVMLLGGLAWIASHA